MGLLVAALPRPRMQRQLVFLGRTVVGGSIDDARLAQRDIGKRRIARRLVIDMGAAKRGSVLPGTEARLFYVFYHDDRPVQVVDNRPAALRPLLSADSLAIHSLGA